MRILKYFFVLACPLVISISGWIYFPHYQMNKIQKEAMEVSKNWGRETYLDYYRQSDKEKIHHLALGDSIIHGFGVGEKENLVYRFSNQLGEEINKTVYYSNKGQNGLTSTELNQLVQKGKYDEEISKSDIITINIGGNDILKTARKKDYYEAVKVFDSLQHTFTQNLLAISHRIRQINPHATIVLLELYNPLPVDHKFTELAESLLPKWNIKIYEVAKDLPSTLVIQTTKVINSKNQQNVADDGVHPNSAGYVAITEQMLRQFSKEFRREAI